MRIEAQTIDEFFASLGVHQEALTQLDAFIQATIPGIERWLLRTDTLCLLGYGSVLFKGQTWPLFSIAPQKQNATLYALLPIVDGRSIPQRYAARLGKVSTGKSCIRFKRFEDFDAQALEALLREAAEWCREKEKKA